MGEQSPICWVYYPKVVRTNKIAISVTFTNHNSVHLHSSIRGSSERVFHKMFLTLHRACHQIIAWLLSLDTYKAGKEPVSSPDPTLSRRTGEPSRISWTSAHFCDSVILYCYTGIAVNNAYTNLHMSSPSMGVS